MACSTITCLGLLMLLVPTHGISPNNEARPEAPALKQREGSLLQTWSQALDGAGAATGAAARDTPVTRAVNLLKEMHKSLQKELDEDEALYKELSCWCNNGKYEKENAISEAESKVEELTSTIESLTAKSAQLKALVADTEKQVAEDKEELAAATAQRKKEAKEFHGAELDAIQALENLKAAMVILGKHEGSAFPQLPVSLLALHRKEEPWLQSHAEHSFDDFLSREGVTSESRVAAAAVDGHSVGAAQQNFLQHAPSSLAQTATGWSAEDLSTVRRALASSSSFMQARHRQGYYPSYQAQSGEILGIMKQMNDEMQADLTEEQKTEQRRFKGFQELRGAKTAQIEEGEKMAERKEDELADTDNALAEAKEDLKETAKTLAADKKFLASLDSTCATADADFEARKKLRLEELEAVADTIEILTGDDARDAMSGTFSLLQVSAWSSNRGGRRRSMASELLRRTAAKVHSPALSLIASQVQLDAFTRVKKAIADMIATLKAQQADEVKKNDWCKKELQSNEMATMKKESEKEDLQAKSAELGETIKRLAKEVEEAKARIEELRVNLQRATQNRQKENLEYQKSFNDQTLTIVVLNKALDRLATFYDKALLLQTGQTPPVPQKEYSKSKGAGGVMSMIEKLIQDAKDLKAGSRKEEAEAQAAYEQAVADTNESVDALQKEVVSKTKQGAKAKKQQQQVDSDIMDAVEELEGLHKYKGNLHEECDYVLKNFDARQQARAEEIEGLQQATQILNGADLS